MSGIYQMVVAEIVNIIMLSKKKILTFLFYATVGIAASLALFIAFYWSLRLNASIDNLIRNYMKSLPLYFWPYVILTFGTIVLFGVSIALLVYRFRKFGMPKLTAQGSTGLGSLIGIAASACPICGSTILSAIGITGGLAAFPLGGLELKAASLGFMALPVWLLRRDLTRLEDDCAKGVCPTPRDPSFKRKDKPWMFGLMLLVGVLMYVAWGMLKTEPAITRLLSRNKIINPADNRLYDANQVQEANNPIYDEVVAKVLPKDGFQSKIYLGDSVVKLVEDGVIDKKKFEEIYKERGGFLGELSRIFDEPATKPILLTRENANYYVNLLWPVGLSNHMSSNRESPIAGKSLFNFASTGGWNLGKEENGGAYFNKFRIVELTPEQEVLVTKIAQSTYRPCCNNSTFYQDCNHGSALLGLLQLGASQGLTEDELYREALVFNSFWFPHNYIQTALFFKMEKNTDWENVDAKEVLGYDYSAISEWIKNVQSPIAKIPNLLPKSKGSSSCGA